MVKTRAGGTPRLNIVQPLDEAMFPADISAPTFRWEDPSAECDAWLVEFAFAGGRHLEFSSALREWAPSDEEWKTIQRNSLESETTVTITGRDSASPAKALSSGSISITTSQDEVAAPLFYREVNLPFREAVKDPSQIRWRFGTVSSRQQPPVVLERLPVCGNCHSFSADGAVLGLDVDYANDKGSYAISPVSRYMTLDREKIISWKDYRRADSEPTFGLLSQVSPDGRYVISTVQDLSVFVPRHDLAFSQLFFPIKGILVVYDRSTREFRALPGADDKQFVQSNPVWSPDGKWIVFARSKTYQLRKRTPSRSMLLSPEECDEFLQGKEMFRFDLYRLAFNGGSGGVPEPLAGASHNGMSNYFPKFSPDGKWIVFCKANSFMLLQPDSELNIIPAEGGSARRLRCNTSRMNSWHSWSPNSKWLVFSSKVYSPYTQLFLTHIDEEGNSSVPVVLSWFTQPDRAANIPEFVNTRGDAIQKIAVDFLDDGNYYRAAIEYIVKGEAEGAVPLLRKALKINPKNAAAHVELAGALARVGGTEEAKDHLAKVFELHRDGPQSEDLAEAHARLGFLLYNERQLPQASDHCRQALAVKPDHYQARATLGLIQLDLGDVTEGEANLARAHREGPEDAFTNYAWGNLLYRQGRPTEAAVLYRLALKEQPDLVPAILGLASVGMMQQRAEQHNGEEPLVLAQRACELTHHKDLSALRILAGAYALAGRFADAISTSKDALRIADANGDTKSAAGIREMLKLYEQIQARKRP
ncbi:MAG: tetratricopeptide repeat protein [Rhodopirellula sp.]|nr:tetratricopeptide repeat protein [Rhodopirellula sp.]